MKAGADDFLSKPVDEETLIPRMEKLLGTRKEHHLKKQEGIEDRISF